MKRMLYRWFGVEETRMPPPYEPARDPELPKMRKAKRQVKILRDRLP